MHLAGEAWVVGGLSTFQQITKFHKKKESKLWHPHTQKLMQVGFIQITINRSLKVFSFVFVAVLILSFVSGFHFYPWWRKVSGRHTSCVPRLESRTFRRELLSCTQTTFTFSQIFQNSSFLQTWSSSTLLFLQVIWFHWRDKDKGSNFLRLSKSQQSPHWNQHQIMHYLPCP